MSVLNEIDDMVVTELESFRMPDKVFLGYSKYSQLVKELDDHDNHDGGLNLIRIYTAAGPLRVIRIGVADALHVEDDIYNILQKLGV